MLLNNSDMVVNIRSARLLRPGMNLQDQLSQAMSGEGPGGTENGSSSSSGGGGGRVVDLFKSPERLEYRQVRVTCVLMTYALRLWLLS